MPTIHRFYTPTPIADNTVVTLPSDESSHALKVLRLGPGDPLIVMDGVGTVADATIMPPKQQNRRLHDALCQLTNVSHAPQPTHPLHLFVAPPKGNNMDLLLKEATELGVSTITPVLCQYGVAKTEKQTKESWTRNLIAAIKQSGNPWLPTLNPPLPFSEALATSPHQGYFGAVPSPLDPDISELQPYAQGEIALWIGPEGGFTAEEEQAMRDHSLIPLTVGKWILRVETAVPALLACIQLLHQDR